MIVANRYAVTATADPCHFLSSYVYYVYYILVKMFILRKWDENETSYPSGKDPVYGTDLLQKSETQRWHGCYKCQGCPDYVIPGQVPAKVPAGKSLEFERDSGIMGFVGLWSIPETV